MAAVGDGKGYEGKDVQMQVKEGDHVIFSKYAGTEVKFRKKNTLLFPQKTLLRL